MKKKKQSLASILSGFMDNKKPVVGGAKAKASKTTGKPKNKGGKDR